MTIEKEIANNKAAEKAELNVLQTIKQFFDDDKIRYHVLDDEAIELYMQAKNLTIQLIIYMHNDHLILRVPGFIRNIELGSKKILMLIMKIMNEILDIRFEISPDGKNLSACCQHIVEDGSVTRAQFDMAMMVLLHVVDDTYPQFMELLYSTQNSNNEFAPLSEVSEIHEIPEERSEATDEADSSDDNEEVSTPKNKDDLKIN